MNALRQYATTSDGNISLKVPAEYMERRLEIIILPADDSTQVTGLSPQMQEAHRVIDEGGGIENPREFLREFEQSRRDRPLPFRDRAADR